jgi:transposase
LVPLGEKTPKKEINDQLSIFNEAELEADASVPEPISHEVKGYVRNDPRTKREELIKDLPVREILCESAPEDQYCLQCGTALKPIGKETVREELEYIPAKLQIVRYVRMAYECPKCKHTDRPYIQKALTPSSLMNHSLASPSSVANVMYQK